MGELLPFHRSPEDIPLETKEIKSIGMPPGPYRFMPRPGSVIEPGSTTQLTPEQVSQLSDESLAVIAARSAIDVPEGEDPAAFLAAERDRLSHQSEEKTEE